MRIYFFKILQSYDNVLFSFSFYLHSLITTKNTPQFLSHIFLNQNTFLNKYNTIFYFFILKMQKLSRNKLKKKLKLNTIIYYFSFLLFFFYFDLAPTQTFLIQYFFFPIENRMQEICSHYMRRRNE